jgi:hypothetical protein
MIESDFNEEYFRVEKNITTNNESVFIDREGKLILTTPFITSEKITDVSIQFAGENQQPKNFNMVVDAVTLFSTNPLCQNYLPLKISLGSKVKIEFNDATFQELEDYKIIVNPRVNLDVIRNIRYTNPTNYAVLFDFTTQPQYIRNIVETQTTAGRKYFYINGINGQVYGTDPDLRSYKVKDGVNDLQLDDIYANNLQAVGSADDTIYDLYFTSFTNPNQIPTPIVISNASILEMFLIKNNLLVFYLNNVDQNYYLEYYIKVNNEYKSVLIVNLGNTQVKVGVYRPNLFYVVNSEFVTRYEVTNLTVLSQREFTFSNPINIVDLDVVYLGGSNIEYPNISLIGQSGTDITWNYYVFPYTSSKQKTYPDIVDPNTLIKRYRNQAYFSNNSRHYFMNLDTFDDLIYSSISSNNLVPRRISSVINLTDFHYVEIQKIIGLTSNPDTIGATALLTEFNNERDLKKVYKLTYNYDERIYLFDKDTYKNLFFQIKLPNGNPISDLEVFKYVIDGRVRYTKEKIDPYGIVKSDQKDQPEEQPLLEEEQCIEQCEEGCEQREPPKGVFKECKDGECLKGYNKNDCIKKCFTRCNRTAGSASRILGLVDEGFNVSEFLNLYTTM